MKEFKINWSEGTAKRERKTEKGRTIKDNFLIFIDNTGVYVETREGRVYFSESNCSVVS